MQYFLEIANEKSISKAANKLFISQSALSQQLIKLEHELGTKLFNRPGSNLALTYDGTCFLKSAQKILFEYRNVYTSIKNNHMLNEGIVTIAATDSRGFVALSHILPDFKKMYPNIKINF